MFLSEAKIFFIIFFLLCFGGCVTLDMSATFGGRHSEVLIMSDSFASLLRRLRMTEKRQTEALEDTREQIKALEALEKKK